MKKYKLFLIISFLFTAVSYSQTPGGKSFYLTNQAPLISTPYTSLPIGAVKPKGWLLKMLQYISGRIKGLNRIMIYLAYYKTGVL